jgi:TRAP-type C4-dicarboxylate transport system substrate-binding protein
MSTQMKWKVRSAAFVVLVWLGLSPAQSQALPKTQLQVVGSISNLAQYRDYEVPFWTRTLSEKSGGAITADIKAFNEMGLKGPEVLRLMGQGVIQAGAALIPYLAADDPANEMIDLAGLLPDAPTARKVTDALRPYYTQLYREKFGVELLGFGTYPAQVLYCNGPLTGLGEVKGKKVRVAGRSQSELIQALGGTPVTLSFGEVVPALQNRTVDCAVTGTLSGNASKWHEVTTHMLALPLSWGAIGYAVNAKAWNAFDPRVRQLIQSEVAALERSIWGVADEFTQQGYECNAGTAQCRLGQKGRMTVVQPSAADMALLKKILGEVTVPKWAERCTATCVNVFNNQVAPLVGVALKK